MRLWLVCYDIADDRRRRHVEKTLLDHGQRVNESVFECFLDSTAFSSLLDLLTPLVDPHNDSLRCYPLCRWCENGMSFQGQGRLPYHPNDWIL